MLADGRLLEAEPGRRAGEAAGLLDGEEGSKKLRVVASHDVHNNCSANHCRSIYVDFCQRMFLTT